jgi:type VI protein secretion system component VasK
MDAGCVLKSNPKFKLSPGFVQYFTALNNWSRLLYGAGRGAPGGMRLQARALRFNNLKQIEITIDGQKVTLAADRGDLQPVNWDVTRANSFQVFGTYEGDPAAQRLFASSGPWAIFEWLSATEPNEGLTWLPRAGPNVPMRLANGSNLKYKLEIRWGDGSNRPLDLHSLQIGTCPPAVTK